MNIPHNFTRVEERLPEHKREVKILVSCSKDPQDLRTTVGWLLDSSKNRWYMEGLNGPCFSVIAWAELDSNTPNFSTETL